MEAEETVLDADVGCGGRITGLEHGGYPGVTDTAIVADAEIVDHPVDGLAGSAATEFETFCRVVHLILGETVFRA